MLSLLLLAACRYFDDDAFDTRAPLLIDGDGDGYRPLDGDCDDANATTYPDAPDPCDHVDNDCDDFTDEDPSPVVYYGDSDGDGFGDPERATTACFPAGAWVENADDCEDGDADVNPDVLEICNGLDDDCTGQADEENENFQWDFWYLDTDGDGFGDDRYKVLSCDPPPGYTTTAGSDCDDTDPAVNPDAREECNDGIDNNCDDTADCRLEGDLDGPGEAFAAVTGSSDGQYLGMSIHVLGDVDGDGGEDFAVLGGEDTDPGDCRIFRGGLAGTRSDGSATLSVLGDTAFTDIAYSLERDTFILGDANRFDYTGALQIIDAGTTGVSTVNDDTAFMVGGAYEYLGIALETSTTIEPDGAERILVGVSFDSTRATWAGRLDVYDSAFAPVATVYGGFEEAFVGTATDVVPDLDGDGLDDIAISAANTESNLLYPGQVGVFLAPLAGEIAFEDADTTFASGEAYASFGYHLAGADYDADGYNDLFIGAYGSTGGTRREAGAVYGVPGPFTDIPHQTDPDTLDRVVKIEGYAENAGFGSSLATGDFDGDGLPDLAVGSEGDHRSEGSPGDGTAWLFYGPFDFDQATTRYAETEDGVRIGGTVGASENFGWSVATIHLNNDTLADLLVGSPGALQGTARDAGAVYAFLGQGF